MLCCGFIVFVCVLDKMVEKGDVVVIYYVGMFEDGMMFDSLREWNELIKFIVGSGMMIFGFDKGVFGLVVG